MTKHLWNSTAAAAVGTTYACVTVNYLAKNLGEISIVTGDVVKIFNYADDFWYIGQTLHNGAKGKVLVVAECSTIKVTEVMLPFPKTGGDQFILSTLVMNVF